MSTRPCKGGCGKTLRPKNATLAQYPGTVRKEARDRCQPCNAVLATPGAKPQHKTRAGQCGVCKRPTRPRGTSAADYPGAVMEHSVACCSTCWRHKAYGPPAHIGNVAAGWGDCVDCGRNMRPHNVTKGEATGTVKHHARGQCVTCHRRQKNPGMIDRPLIVGAPDTLGQADTEPDAELAPVVSDPGLLKLQAARRERKAKLERGMRVRAAREAARARFLQARRAAA